MTRTSSKHATIDFTQNRLLSRKPFRLFVFLSICAAISIVKSVSADPMRYRGGMRNSADTKKLTVDQMETVIKSLREKTGFAELGFDENGFLKIGDPHHILGGSASARALIKSAVEANKAIDLEAHNRSSSVAFARLAKPTIYQSRATGATIDVYPIEIDFSDFSKLRGNKKVIAAFDVGFVIMHELGHAVLGLRDALDESEGPGECEEYVNRIRRELNLPERQTYFARTHKANLTTVVKPIEQAELIFTQSESGKPRKLSLYWEAAMVGPIRQIPYSIAKSGQVNAAVSGQ